MHGEAALTPWALVVGYLVRFGVPLVCAAIVIDAARRSEPSIGHRARIVWIALPLTLLVLLVLGFIAPGVGVLRLVAVVALPVVFVMGVAYLITVVFGSAPPGVNAAP